MKNQAEWYAIPPYEVSNESWRIFNEKGELIATFETKEDCLLTVKLFNKKKKTDEKVD